MSSDTDQDDPQDDPQEERTQSTATRSGRASAEASADPDGSDLDEETIVIVESGSTVVDIPDADPDPDRTERIVTVAQQNLTPGARLAPSSSLRPLLLERIEPSLGRGERIRLDASHWKRSLGRAEESDVRLYTASASREHAVISGNAAGEWVLTLATGKSVLIDGERTTESVVLEAGMNIILGQDHLRCVTEGLGRREMAAETAANVFKDPVDSKSRILRRGRCRLDPLRPTRPVTGVWLAHARAVTNLRISVWPGGGISRTSESKRDARVVGDIIGKRGRSKIGRYSIHP